MSVMRRIKRARAAALVTLLTAGLAWTAAPVYAQEDQTETFSEQTVSEPFAQPIEEEPAEEPTVTQPLDEPAEEPTTQPIEEPTVTQPLAQPTEEPKPIEPKPTEPDQFPLEPEEHSVSNDQFIEMMKQYDG